MRARIVGSDEFEMTFDLSAYIADKTDCTNEDMSEIIGLFFEFLTGERPKVKYVCRDGTVVKIYNRFGKIYLEIEE